MQMAGKGRSETELTQAHLVGKLESQRGPEGAHEGMGVSMEKRLLEG